MKQQIYSLIKTKLTPKFVLQMLIKEGILRNVTNSILWQYWVKTSYFRSFGSTQTYLECFFSLAVQATLDYFGLLREGWRYQIGLFFGKITNGLRPPPLIFRKLYCKFLYQFHAQKALFKVPKICKINFWIGNAPPFGTFPKIHLIWKQDPSRRRSLEVL